MRKFILKSTIFVIPFLIIHVLSYFFFFIPTKWANKELSRVGYILSNPFSNNIEGLDKRKFTLFSELSMTNQRYFKILTVGDSFSDQLGNGYNNYLALNDSINLLHLDGDLNSGKNPILSVLGFLNGDVLDSLKIEYLFKNRQ